MEGFGEPMGAQCARGGPVARRTPAMLAMDMQKRRAHVRVSDWQGPRPQIAADMARIGFDKAAATWHDSEQLAAFCTHQKELCAARRRRRSASSAGVWDTIRLGWPKRHVGHRAVRTAPGQGEVPNKQKEVGEIRTEGRRTCGRGVVPRCSAGPSTR